MTNLKEEREAIVGALARGYCSEKNSHKVLDPDLIETMAIEVEKLLLSHEEKVVARVREEIRKSFDEWFKNGTEDVEDWADRTLPITDESV